MAARHIWMGFGVVALGAVRVWAQTPVLGSIEAPYASIQSSVQIAGHSYGPGGVAYGPVGTPLVLSGSDLGATGTVEFIAYKNGAVDQDVSPVVATPTLWGSTMIFVPVPSGAMTGMVQVIVEGKVSNPLPFIVTSGAYAGSSCPAGPTTTQLQIVTSSLHDGQVGQSYSATLSASGGTQSYAWSVGNGTLPSGLSLNAATGTISGTPTTAVSPASLTFEVTDSSSPHQSNQAVLDLTIEPQQMNAATVYSYTASYDGDGNVSSYSDSIDNSSGSIMGSWNFKYDDLNRLRSGQATAGGFNGQNQCWAYDIYGNRTAQIAQSSACPSSESGLTPTVSYNSSNHLSSGLVGYDAAGNITSDATSGNTYLYDAEGRVCAAKSQPVPGTYTMTGYIYDADGSRVAKGTITSMSCDPTVNGFQITENYVLGPSGEELSTLDGNNNWQRTNVYAAGKLVGTYDAAGLHFHLEDPLGTRRMQLSGNPNFVGCPETDIQSLPYGDGLYSFPDQYACATADDATPLHFTGKERDAESGNDYFGARYYASAMGRWLSPDWSAQEDPVPYARLDDPQTLNLYSYVRNNPLVSDDPDGHAFCPGWCDPNGQAYQTQSEIDAEEKERNAQRGYGAVTNAQLDKRIAEQRAYLINAFPNEKDKLESNDGATIFHEYMCVTASDCGKTRYDDNPVLIQIAVTLIPTVFRGGTSLQVRPGIDVKPDAQGMLQPGRGLSVNADASALAKFGGAHEVESVPQELEIIQRGGNPNHYEIAPRAPMTLQRFQELLNQVKLK